MMEVLSRYWDIFKNGYTGYASYLWEDITNPTISSYFYWLIVVSLLFFVLEVVMPWRKDQKKFRRDFWLDAFFMFFNFFLFSLIIYNAASDVIVNLLNDGIKTISGGFDLQANNPLNSLPLWGILLIGFVVRDFVQWWVHRLLHRLPRLWEFHKVHHSVQEMGFAAHLRFHWMETVVYRTLEYLPLALLGIGLYDFFIIHIFTLAWGHFNHSNITVSGRVTGGILGFLIGLVLANNLLGTTLPLDFGYGSQVAILALSTVIGVFVVGPFMKTLFNSPELHLWHHSYELPDDRQYGVNFGLTLAIWDYIFGTAHQPHDRGDIRLGFPGIEEYPENFIELNTSGFKKQAE